MTNKNPQDENGDQNFIKKDEPQTEKQEQQENQEEEAGIEGVKNRLLNGLQEAANKLKNFIFAEKTQQRNLDRETGGLEAKKDKGISKKDIWDDRPEEVDKMAEKNVFETPGMKSVVWKKKKERLEEKKRRKEMAAAGAEGAKGKSNLDNTPGQGQQGYVARLKNLRQDRTNPFDDGRGGGRYQ